MPLFGRGKPKGPTFDADPEVADEAKRWAANFVTWAGKHFSVQMDLSDTSIALVEVIAEEIDEEIRVGRASPEPKFAEELAPLFGYYVGETYVTNHGGRWGWTDLPGGIRTVAVETTAGGIFWPVVKSLQRLLREPDSDLSFYYQAVCLKV